ncbi:MAG: AlkA N-terminal domain-containing protein, partial [Actinomycetota bacterium]|nr:AlkA N-terminal domain-containing protein [Actinomycetota bacterium]
MKLMAFTAVVTTGIYCRPGCPATPLRRNMAPYLTAAAAEANGYRACLRCRPDREPEPGWIDAPELVCRALRLIADGGLDGATEDELAARLGVSARHLRRLFDTHVGATPGEVARSRRTHFARRLLDDTDLTLAAVARAAGFSSVRHMNRLVQQVFKATPTELRAKRRNPTRNVADGGLELRLPYRPPLAWDTMLAFLAPRAIPGVEAVDQADRAYRRTIDLDGDPGVIELTAPPGESFLVLRAHLPRIEDLVHVVARVRRQFDLDADPQRIDAHLSGDRLLRPLVRRHPGLRVPGAFDPVEVGVRAILGQQVTVAGATRLAGRLVERYGRPVPGLEELGLSYLFPTAETLAGAPLDDIGITTARSRAIRAFAAATFRRSVPLDGSQDLATVVEELCDLPGIGDWTAQYVAMRAGGERDAFPAGDLGLRKVLGLSTPREALTRAESWRPWRAYAALHLWTSGD